MKKAGDPHTRAILKDLAKEKLEHRNKFEQVLLGEWGLPWSQPIFWKKRLWMRIQPSMI